MSPWLKIRSTGAEFAGTQHIEFTNGRIELVNIAKDRLDGSVQRRDRLSYSMHRTVGMFL